MRAAQRDAVLERALAAATKQAALADDPPVAEEPPQPAPPPPVSAEPEVPEPSPATNGADPLALLDERRQEPEAEPTVYLSFRIPASLRRQVHRRCLDYNLSVQEFGRCATELLLREMERRAQ